MKHLHHYLPRLCAATALLLTMTACAGKTKQTDTAPETEAEKSGLTSEQIAQDVLTSMDPTADPCQDFYQYACGGWLAETELPGDRARWVRSFSVIDERNRGLVRNLLESAAADPSGTPESQMIGTYYTACMDEEAIAEAGADPLAPWLETISKATTPADFMTLTGQFHRIAVGVLFNGGALPDFKDPEMNIAIYIQGGLGMPDRDYYVSEDEDKRNLLQEYEGHIAHMLRLLGESEEGAQKQAAQILAFETRLAQASRPRQQMRIIEKLYNKIDRKGLQGLTPKLPWDNYFEAIQFPEIRSINVATPEFFEELGKAISNTDPEALRAYFRWHLVHSHAQALAPDFVNADFEFFGKQVRGQQEIEPRWKRCVQATEGALGEAVGKLYVADNFPGSSKEIAVEMIQDIENSFEESLPKLAWMDETTRERAVIKAQAISDKIGFPDAWRDYSSIDLVPGQFFHNHLESIAFEIERDLRKVGQPVDKTEWGMTPQTVNAYYNPLQNEIAFPAGILQPPFFHRDFPAAMNYGAIGAVMGHELSHGFDDQGRKFDPQGQLREWWEPAASEKFETQASCVADLYSTYEVEPGLAVNGSLTLGENIADIGGVKQAFKAYQSWQERHEEQSSSVEGLTDEQLFFVAFGQVWCSLTTPEHQRLRITTDSHSPPRFRVIGPLSNSPAFAEAFSCQPGQPMSPEERCEVW